MLNPYSDLILLSHPTFFDTRAREDASLDRMVRIRACNRSRRWVIRLCPVLMKRDVRGEHIVDQFDRNGQKGRVNVDFPSLLGDLFKV